MSTLPLLDIRIPYRTSTGIRLLYIPLVYISTKYLETKGVRTLDFLFRHSISYSGTSISRSDTFRARTTSIRTLYSDSEVHIACKFVYDNMCIFVYLYSSVEGKPRSLDKRALSRGKVSVEGLVHRG